MIVNRDFRRTESDDFKLNIEPLLERNAHLEAVEIWQLPPGVYIQGREELVGWKIQNRYE